MFNYDLCISTISGTNSRTMICFHGYGGNGHLITELKDSGLIDSTLVGFNFPDHDIPEKSYDPNELTFGTIAELLPALYVLKKYVIDDNMSSIDLYGRSAGGGALINVIAILNAEWFNNELLQIGLGREEKKQLLTAIQNGLIILDGPLKSVEEIIDFRGSTNELEMLAKNYRDNHLRPIDTVELLHGLSLDIIVHFQESDEIISNRDDQMYINKLTQANLGNTSTIIGNDGGHTGLHRSLWQFYAEKLPEKEMSVRSKFKKESKYMHVDSLKTEILDITIRGHVYPVQKIGVGIPCLMLCLCSPSLRTISSNFSRLFEIYSSDLYWIKNATCPDERLTLDIVLDDIKSQIDALKLEQCVLFAHSAYGIIALEFAKKYPNAIRGIIMVGTPVNCNALVAEKNQKIFELEADPHRKAIDAQNKARFHAMDKQSLTPEQLFLQEYIYRDAARYWYDPEFNCSDLWEGIVLGQRLVELFANVLPEINVLNNLDDIKLPVFLAAGLYDFDCCPWEWGKVKNLPKQFKLIHFKYSGHWPQCEESEQFNLSIRAWIDERLC